MALSGPDCSKAVYGQVTMAFPGGNIIEEATELIADALALVAASPPGGAAVALKIRVTDGSGNPLNCCPDGFGYDSVAQTCKILPPKPAPPPSPPGPTPPPPPPPGLGDGGGDELTIGIDSILLELQQIILLLQELTGPAGQPVDYTKCCHAIAVGIAALVKIVNKISVILSAPGIPPTPPLDLTAVIVELTCACENLTAISTSSATVANDLAPGLKSIADAITKQTGTDVSKIVEQLKTMVRQGDVKDAIFQALNKQGLVTSADLQTLHGLDWGDALSYLSHTRAVRAVEKFMGDVGAEAGTIANDIETVAAPVGRWAERIAVGALKMERNVIQSALEIPLKAAISALIPAKLPTIGQIGVNPDTVLADVVAVGLNMLVIAALVGLTFPGAAEQLAHITEVATAVLGFDELKEVQIGPLVEHGIRRVAEMNAKRVYRQEMPGVGQLANYVARGLLTPERYGQIAALTGIPTEFEATELLAAETGLQPFILLRLASTGLFKQADLVDELTFRGVRPESQHRILIAAPYIETQKERDALRGTLEKGYAGGFFADADFTTRIEQIEQITDKPTLILDKVRLERAFAGAKDLENAYETEFLAGITDVPQYQSKLAGIGLQPDYVAYLMAKAEAHANARLVRQAAAAERALARATVAEERRAALTQYQAGTINETALAGLLIGTGLTPVQAAAWIAQATGQRAGKLRLQYGLRLSPAEATLLRQRVADLTRQRELQMLTDAQYVTGLTSLKIPPTFVNALRAGANAALKPKTAAILTPVTVP